MNFYKVGGVLHKATQESHQRRSQDKVCNFAETYNFFLNRTKFKGLNNDELTN